MIDAERVAYVVTSGSYSDYRVHAVFTSRELAEKFVGPLEWGVEEFPLNPGRPQNPDWVWYVHLDILSGNLTSVYVGEPRDETIADRVGWSGLTYDTCIQADTKERAIKVANERLLRWKAEHVDEVAEIAEKAEQKQRRKEADRRAAQGTDLEEHGNYNISRYVDGKLVT